MTPEEEFKLLQKIKSDPEEFGVLFDYYYSKILGYVIRRTAQYDTAKDITAETFLKAFLKIKDFEWRGVSISSWFYRIATNEINYFFRKRKYKPSSLDLFVDTEAFDVADEETIDTERQKIEDELKHHEEFMQVQKLIAGLPLKYQEVIALKYFEEKSIKEISEILDKKEGTVKSLLSRGIGKLRELI